MCSPVGHHLQGPPLHQGKCLFSFFEKGCYIGLCVGKWGKYWATSQSCRRSFSVVINTACDGKLPPWIGTDGTQIRAGLFTVLMERLNTWRSGAFLTVCLDAQCNHLIFLVHPRFAGVMDAESLAQPPPNAFENVPHSSTGCGILASFNFFHSPNASPNIPGNCFHLAPLCCGAQVDSGEIMSWNDAHPAESGIDLEKPSMVWCHRQR